VIGRERDRGEVMGMAKVDIAALKKACGKLAEEVIDRGSEASDVQVEAVTQMARVIDAHEAPDEG
jgi:hypothetical protein